MAAVIGSLRAELSATVAQFQADMGKAADAVKKTAGEFTKAGNDFKNVGAQMQGVGLALTKSITLPLAGLGLAVAKVGMDFEDAFAGVKKTVAGSEQDLQGISDAFRDMAKTIPTSATELAKIGEIAGQLGVGKENIVAFTKTISDIATATHLTADEAATSFARLAIILKVPQDQFESLGSAVYSLGNFGSSTEQEMLAMAQRIAGAGATVGLTAADVLGLSNALSSVGVEAEAGGTAMSKILIKMATAAHDGGKALETFAKIAGESGAEFKTQFQTNAGAAVVAFVQGLGKIQSSGGDLLGTIQELGFEEVRLRDATLRMANAGNVVADSVSLSNKTFSDHSAFVKAVEERYKTTTNQLKILGNQIADVGTTLFTALKPAIESAIHLVQALLPYVDSLAKAFAALPGGVQLAVIGVAAFAAALGPIIYISGQLVSSLGVLTLAFGKGGLATRGILGGISLARNAMQALDSAILVDGALMFEWGKKTVSVGGWLGKLTGSVGTLASSALGPLSGVLSTVGTAIAGLFNPVTLVIGGFIALGLGIAALTGHWDDVKAGIAAVITVVKDVASGLWYLAKTVITTLVDGLIELAKWLGSGLVAGFQALLSVARAIITPFVDFGIAINDAINNLGPLGTVLKVVGVALLAMVNPVAGVVAGIALMVGHWEDFKAVIGTVVQVVGDVGTVLGFLAKGAIADLVDGLSSLAKWLGSSIVSGFQSLVSVVQAVVQPFAELASLVAGPVIDAFKALGSLLGGAVAGWFSGLIGWVGKVASATRDLAVNGIKDLHDYATAVRDAAKDIEAGFQQANKALGDYRKTITDRAIPTAALDIGTAFATLKSQLSGLNFGGGSNGFKDLLDSLKAARAELAALSSTDLARLTEAVKSGAFSMKEISEATGLSDMALKLFQEQVRESAKELKASQSIFDDYKKKVAELTTGLTEALKFGVPVEFIKRQFGTVISDVVDQAGILGKTLPKVISDAFLKITIADATDHLLKEFAKFGDEMNKQVKADMDRRNTIVIKALDVTIESEKSAADSIAQFSIAGLQNQIKNIEAVYGQTKQSIDLKKQLYAEEYQYQIDLISREAQAKKDSLDKTVQIYDQSLTAIDNATSLKMGLASQAYQQKITEMQNATKKWQDSLGALAGAFSQISSATSGVFSDVAKDISNLIGSYEDATKAAKQFNAAKAAGDKAGQVAALAGGIAAVAQATSSKNKATSVAGGALSGGTTGAAVGSVFPVIGTGVGFAVGAGVGALVGWIRAIHKGPAEKAALDVGRDFGVTISEGLAKELGDQGKLIGRQAANIFNLDKIIGESGGLTTDNVGKFTAKLRDTFVLVKQGALTAADGASVLDKNFKNFADQFLKNGPLISKELVEIVKLTDEMGIKSQAVADFIASQVTGTILPGLEAFANASKGAVDGLAENQKKLADLQTQLASASGGDQESLRKEIASVTEEIRKQQGVISATTVTSEAAASALSATVAVAFSEMQKAGIPILEIADKLAPVVDGLAKQFEAAGFTGGAAFEKIRGIVALASDEIAGPAIQAATGLGQALSGLSNIGQLDQGTFTGLTDQIDATFNSLIAQGNNAPQVLALMQQPLQAVWQLATEFGYAIDDGTKSLLEQAQAAGIVGEKQKPLQEQMLDATNKIADAVTGLAKVFGVDLPASVATGAGAVTAGAAAMATALGGPAAGAQATANTLTTIPTAMADATAATASQAQGLAGAMSTAIAGGAQASAAAIGGLPAAMGAASDSISAQLASIQQQFAVGTPDSVAAGTAAATNLLATLGQDTSGQFSGMADQIRVYLSEAIHSVTGELDTVPVAMAGATAESLTTTQEFASSMRMIIGEGAIGASDSLSLLPVAMDGAASSAGAAAAALGLALATSIGDGATVAGDAISKSLPDAMWTASGSIGSQLATIQQLFAVDTPESIAAGVSAASGLLAGLSSDTGGEFGGMADDIKTYLAVALEGVQTNLEDLPGDTKTVVDQISDILSKIKIPDLTIPIHLDDQTGGSGATPVAKGGKVTSSGVQYFDQGGIAQVFKRRGTDTIPAMLTPGELVLNKAQQQTLSAQLSAPMSVLQQREGRISDSHLAEMNQPQGSESVAVPAVQHFHFSLQAIDQTGLRDLVTRPGGVAELVAVAAGQGKHGLDEKFRRSLRIK